MAAVCLLALPVASHADTLSVAVAANLQPVFAQLQAAFEARGPHRLQPSFSSSGKLVSQIMLGAPFDVFLSADMQFPQALQRAGFSSTVPAVYARGVLVLWSARRQDLRDWQTWLKSPAVTRLVLANPQTAPYGREAVTVLAHYGLAEQIKHKLVYAESISQVNQYVDSGTVDAGFTAKSAVVRSPMRVGEGWIAVPPDAYRPIDQGVVITRHGAQTHPQAAQAFLAFLTTAAARAVLAGGGYELP